MPPENDEPETDPREAARIRARDRKRRTEMVVDNAGVRRIVLARAQRRRHKEQDKTPVNPSPDPPGRP